MSDLSVILDVLRRLPGVLLVEPGREIVMQDEVHHEGRELIRGLGDPAVRSYVGWHTQSDAFDRAGNLSGRQRIYFGGDRATVAAGLTRLESEGFAVFGGRSDDESFVVCRDAFPTGVEPGQLEQWRTRLEVLGGGAPDAPLREGELGLLHELLRTASMRELLEPAVKALLLRNEITPGDLDVVLTPKSLPHLGEETSPLMAFALQTGPPAGG